MSLFADPKSGHWTDYMNHRSQWLLTENLATWVKVIITAWALLSTPYVFYILRNTILELFYRSPSDTSEATRVDKVLWTSHSSRSIATEFTKRIADGRYRIRSKETCSALGIVFVLLLSFVIQVCIIGYLVSEKSIGLDRAGLLDSNTCGLYEYDYRKGGEEDAARASILNSEKERRAAEYAQDCYGADGARAMLCDFFYNSDIQYTRIEDACPFVDSRVCADGYQEGSAVTFDTGLVDAAALGINYSPTHKFRRITTCAPLNVNPPFVRHFNNGGTDHGYVYNFGSLWNTDDCIHQAPKRLNEYTMRITGHPFDWDVPAYRVNTYATSLLDPMCDFYQPISNLSAPGLDVPRTRTLTIVFVAALHILYSKKSNDPIFPADKPFRYPGESKDYYVNSNPKSRPFACIDETKFCAPSGSPCWTAIDPIPDGVANTSAYWLMKYSLQKSNIYDSIKLRLGSALLAQQQVGMSRSTPLPDNHWEREVEQLFRASLARAQFDAWRISSGEDHDIPTYTDTMPDEAKGKVCGLFKFNTVGYVNIMLWPIILLVLFPPITFILSFETKTVKNWWYTTRRILGRSGENGRRAPPDEGNNERRISAEASSSHSHRTSNFQQDVPHPSPGNLSHIPAELSGPEPQAGTSPPTQQPPVTPSSRPSSQNRMTSEEQLPVPRLSIESSHSTTGGQEPQQSTPLTTALTSGTIGNYGSFPESSTTSLLARRPLSSTVSIHSHASQQGNHTNSSGSGDRGFERIVFHSIIVTIYTWFTPTFWSRVWRRDSG